VSLKDILSDFHKSESEGAISPSGEVVDIAEAFWTYIQSVGSVKDERRTPGYHPSQMFAFCPRREVLEHHFPKPEASFIPPELQMIFDWGTAWHWLAQNNYFGPMGILWGMWTCNGCSTKIEGFMPDPCKSCHPRWKPGPVRYGGYWTYIEPHVFNKEWQIPGHGDGILILDKKPDGKRSLLEIKTINGARFRMLSKPDEKYVFQINIYLWLLGLDRCWLTYWSKDADQQRPKVFRISYDPEIPNEVMRRIRLHKRAWPEKRLCEGVCKTDRDKLALDCPQRGNCFNPMIEAIVEKMRVVKP
jgi:hypothetical protein